MSPSQKRWLPVATKWWEALEEAAILPLKHQNMTQEQRDAEVNQWAVVLEQVQRLDKIPEGHIIGMLDWLLKVDSFWIHKGPLQGLSNLRGKTSRGTRKIDTIYASYQKHKEGKKDTHLPKPTHGDKYTDFDAKRVREAYPDLASNFKRFPIDDAEREYIYIDPSRNESTSSSTE